MKKVKEEYKREGKRAGRGTYGKRTDENNKNKIINGKIKKIIKKGERKEKEKQGGWRHRVKCVKKKRRGKREGKKRKKREGKTM